MNFTQTFFSRLLFLSILLINFLEMPLARADDNFKINYYSKSSASFFISGHSLTDNPYADYLVQITNSLGVKAEYNQQIVVGSPIRVRTRGNDPTSKDFTGYQLGKNREGSGMKVLNELRDHKTIQSQQYNYLIITERHDLVDVVVWESTDEYLRHYHDQFMMKNNGRIYFFVPWLGRKKLKDINSWIAYEESALKAWECVISKVNHGFILEESPPMNIIPANVALVELVKHLSSGSFSGELCNKSDFGRLTSLFSDDVHLTKLGVYYIALVTYASVFNSSPEGAWYPKEISQKTALYLQDLAWKFVSSKGTNIPSLNLTSCSRLFAESFCKVYSDYTETVHHLQSCRDHFSQQNKSSLFYVGDK